MSNEGLARFCTAKYEAPNKSNYKKAFMHLTNYSINKYSDDYVKPQEADILIANDGTKRTLSSLYSSLRSKGIDVNKLKQGIKQTCSKVMQIYGPFMEHQVKSLNNAKPIDGTPFQVLGFDLLIDENLKAWILEVNDHPSMNIYFQKDEYSLQGKKQTEPDDQDLCEVDLHVKSTVVTDAINIVT